jgi:hypothetical protein
MSLNCGLQRAYCSSPYDILLCMQSHGGIILIGKNRRTQRKLSPSVTFSTTNPTCTDPGRNPCLHGERSAANRLSHGTAWLCHTQEQYIYTSRHAILMLHVEEHDEMTGALCPLWQSIHPRWPHCSVDIIAHKIPDRMKNFLVRSRRLMGTENRITKKIPLHNGFLLQSAWAYFFFLFFFKK